MTPEKAASQPVAHQAFRTAAEFDRWLKRHHASATELWVRVFKKGSGIASVTWDECIPVALAWGWIDGVRRGLDEVSFIQRFTPRRAKSSWSKRNCELAERLIADGHMQPAGMVHVEAARKDGRWDRAYERQSTMTVPPDFLEALERRPAAKACFATLNRSNLFAIYYRLQSARRPETRARRMAAILDTLEKGERLF